MKNILPGRKGASGGLDGGIVAHSADRPGAGQDRLILSVVDACGRMYLWAGRRIVTRWPRCPLMGANTTSSRATISTGSTIGRRETAFALVVLSCGVVWSLLY